MAEPPAKSRKLEQPLRNTALVFIKPHAVTDAVKKLAEQALKQKGINVLASGEIVADVIDKKGLIDTHYGSIAARAMKLEPSELPVQPEAKEAFLKLFGASWENALEQGLVFNALDAATKLNVSLGELGDRFDRTKRGVDQVKFGGGFYVARVDSIYVVNGFYSRMRAEFTKPGTSIFYYSVEWDPATLSWADFRGKVLGATNPKEATPGSIRNEIFLRWQELGLSGEPSTAENGMHASASPFEGLAERANWLGADASGDPLSESLVSAGVDFKTIEAWMGDPSVVFEGRKQSLFDLLEDLDAQACVDKAGLIVKSA